MAYTSSPYTPPPNPVDGDDDASNPYDDGYDDYYDGAGDDDKDYCHHNNNNSRRGTRLGGSSNPSHSIPSLDIAAMRQRAALAAEERQTLHELEQLQLISPVADHHQKCAGAEGRERGGRGGRGRRGRKVRLIKSAQEQLSRVESAGAGLRAQQPLWKCHACGRRNEALWWTCQAGGCGAMKRESKSRSLGGGRVLGAG